MKNNSTVWFGEQQLTIELICELADQQAKPKLSKAPEFVDKIEKGTAFLDSLLANEGVIYGVTTGYGDSVTVSVDKQLVEQLPRQLTRFHGCGLGQYFSERETRAIIATRLASLCRGVSGVSGDLLHQLVGILDKDILPQIPEEGSVGASGDLTPLSYIAATLIGERQVSVKGEVMPANQALAQANMVPIQLRPKEGLALMNGTAVMTAIACLNWQRAERLCQLATRITSMVCLGMKGNAFHFDSALHAVKPHPGQVLCAQRVREDLNGESAPRNSDRLQDRYSLRCAPHVIGVLQDTLNWARSVIEIELNSANDNPIIDGENERVLHGGHFYGGHIAMVMDALKTAVANVADLLDRQLAQLCDYKFNNGLPYNLSGASGEVSCINHGFKALQIGVSAWTAEALKNTMPASVFSRSTESHNQDKVSMGTISARDCRRTIELTDQVAIACLFAATQAIELRQSSGEIHPESLTESITNTISETREISPFLEQDRPLEMELRKGLEALSNGHWTLY
ncbi:HAL/PAL/TAL family ammonia-lyase [Paraferrimonas sedimenticola]|uniref:tyrosine ammonia-lyase n=1 Tax=Paraferrimonas sedimenticola TaxID=375674 RepID=A0AA37RXN1_9GAMM|nr:aromatic amino acid ammonia-lyase [Paraferrimonas sedimenticola]GLP97035.1 histidine ammonia-lyase [Paraferrimonas sedimenticola]